MTLKDMAGAPLEQGEAVLFSLGFGVSTIAVIHKTETVISGNQPPVVHLSISIPLPAAPNGVVGGILKVSTKPQSSLVAN